MFSLWFFTFPYALALNNHKDFDQKYPKEFPEKWIEKYPDGAFCCDKSQNLVTNGNFENGNFIYDSSYAYDSDILPGQYDVTGDATDFVTTITDHSYCESQIQYSRNDKYLLVNGLTNQPAGSKSVIWQQKIEKLGKGKRYRFCANFRNLRQCTHDVLPVVTVQLSSGFSQTVTIDTDQNDSCDWQQVSFCFSAESKVTVTIWLKESSLGDGNDLAVDDVSVQELNDPQLTTTVQYQYDTNDVWGSINTISTSDDMLSKDCGGFYYWFVVTVKSYSGGVYTVNWSAPVGWGNSMVSIRLNPFAVGPPWHLTTSFPGFVFLSNTLYAIGMVTPECCEGCLAHGWTYHVVYPSFFNTGKMSMGEDIGNSLGESMGEDTGNSLGKSMGEDTNRNDHGEELFTSDYGLTEKDLLDVEQWVGTSDVPKL